MGLNVVRNPRDRVGINWIDDLVGTELFELNAFFDANPRILWADMNSLAFMNTGQLARGYTGYVVLSNRLLGLLTTGEPAAQNVVFTILAHEYAHLYQYEKNWWSVLTRSAKTKKALELHADYLAGFYLAKRENRFPEYQPSVVVERWYELGDFRFTDREHHGTPSERVDALSSGYAQGGNFLARLHQAAVAGHQWVGRL